MNNCPYCGAANVTGKNLCPVCGRPIYSKVQTDPQSAQVYPAQQSVQAPQNAQGYPAQQNVQAPQNAQGYPAQQNVQPQSAQYQQAQQYYPAEQYNVRQNDRKPRRHSPMMTALVIGLAVVLAVEGVIAGWWYPGFFRSGGGTDLETLLSQTMLEKSEVVDAAAYPMPGKVGDIVNSYTQEEYDSAPTTSIPVSPDSPKASSGRFAADFGEWNLLDEDTLIIKELPVHEDETTGYTITGYDFSLASGQDEFFTEVVLTIPRDPSDEDDSVFVTKSHETGKYEYSYFEISEDGSSYLIYTDHFSEQDRISHKGYVEGISEDLADDKIDDPKTLEALSAFYYPNKVTPANCMTAPVKCNYNLLWNGIATRYTRLPPGIDLIPYIADEIQKTPKDKLAYSSPLTKLMYTNEGADILNNANTVRQNASKFSFQALSPQVKNAAAGAVKAGGRLTFSTGLGAANTLIGYYFTLDKMSYEAKQGKYLNWSDCYEKNWLSYLGLGIGVVGVVAVPGGAVALTAAIAGLGVYGYSYYCSLTQPRELSSQEQLYRDYFLSAGNYSIKIYYDEPKTADMRDSGIGYMKKLGCLTDAQNKKLKQYLNKKMSMLRTGTGIPGDDPRKNKRIDQAWVAVLSGLFILLKDEPKKYTEAFNEFFDNYTEACWNMSDSAYLTFARDAMRQRGWDPTTANLLSVTNPDNYKDIKNQFAQNLKTELLAKYSPVILANIVMHVHIAKLEVQQIIEDTLLPKLNTMIEFSVEDNSLPDPKEFAQSVYNTPLRRKDGVGLDNATYYGYPDFSKLVENSMYFTVKNDQGKTYYVNKPVFLARSKVGTRTKLMDYDSYYPAHPNFLPHFNDKSGNVVFRCTYFHYLMMGSPTAMSFHDVSGAGKNDKTVDFELPEPDADGVIRVKITAPPEKQANTLEMKITADRTMNYGINENIDAFVDNPMPARNIVSLNDDGKHITFDLPSVDHSFQSVYDQDNKHIVYTYSFTRSDVKLTGVITDTNYDSSGHIMNRKGVILTAPEVITGSGKDSSVRTTDAVENYEMYNLSELTLKSIVTGDETMQGEPPDGVSWFIIRYDDSEKPEAISIWLYADGLHKATSHNDREGYTVSKKQFEIDLELPS